MTQHNNSRGLFAIAALFANASVSSASVAKESVAIVGAKVHVAPGKVLDPATVVIRDGLIVSVSSDARGSFDATTKIDGSGKTVTAGFIEPYTHLGLVDVAMEQDTVEGQFGDTNGSVHASYRVFDGYNPASMTVPIAVKGGITSVVAVPSGGLVAGQSSWLMLQHGAVDPSRTLVEQDCAMHAQLGTESLRFADRSRGHAITKLRELLVDAGQWAARRNRFEQNQTRNFSANHLDLQALHRVREGLPLVIAVNRASDILASLRLARQLQLTLVIAGGAEAWQVRQELAAANVAVILKPSANLPRNFDSLHVRNDNAALLIAAGVPVAFSTLGDETMARTLRQQAGIAVSYGVAWDDALAAITTVPARIYGGARHTGTIAPGRRADLVLWSGDPFELSSHAETVFIAGRRQPLETRQDQLFERYRALP